MNQKSLPVIIAGTGGASKEVYYIIKNINIVEKDRYFVVGFIEKEENRIGDVVFDNQKIIASDTNILEVISHYEQIGIIIPLSNAKAKQRLAENLSGYKNVWFPNIVHPSVIIESDMQMGNGNIISAGSVIACDVKMGDFNLINRCCTIGHDVVIKDFNTINPATVISGNVSIGSKCLLGAGSIILQGLTIEDEVIIGAGAVLKNKAGCGITMVGIPAKRLDK